MTVAEFLAHVEARRARVEAALSRALPRPPASPPILDVALRYSLEAGGKRMRPVLALLAAEAVTDAAEQVALAEPAACALELIHTYSLVHDDLPAMDNDTLRRGRPTAHVVFGDGLAILAGDGLLTEAFALLAREPRSNAPEVCARKLRAIEAVAAAAGTTGMVGGQAIDLAAAGQVQFPAGMTPPTPDADFLSDMHARKTGALITASAVAGAIMAGGTGAQVAALATYASHLGLAFQIADDILDVEGAAADLGKTAGKDAAAGKPTYPSLFGLEGARQRAVASRDAALRALDAGGLHATAPLAALARWAVERRK